MRAPGKRTIQRAIRILAEAAATDGMILMAADRLGLYPTPASRLALRVFYDDAIGPGYSDTRTYRDGPHYRQAQACGAGEALLREGWLP